MRASSGEQGALGQGNCARKEDGDPAAHILSKPHRTLLYIILIRGKVGVIRVGISANSCGGRYTYEGPR